MVISLSSFALPAPWHFPEVSGDVCEQSLAPLSWMVLGKGPTHGLSSSAFPKGFANPMLKTTTLKARISLLFWKRALLCWGDSGCSGHGYATFTPRELEDGGRFQQHLPVPCTRCSARSEGLGRCQNHCRAHHCGFPAHWHSPALTPLVKQSGRSSSVERVNLGWFCWLQTCDLSCELAPLPTRESW